MSRAADYTIQGFLYQFNKTALEILKAKDDEVINVEGIVEDIEVMSSMSLKAIQCKYHEASTSFTPSAVYKPLLQMLEHFSNYQKASISYVLFAHFPGVSKTPPTVDKSTLQAALASKDQKLEKYIKVIPTDIDLDSFGARFTMEFGPSYDEIVIDVHNELESSGIPSDDIEALAYPNTIHKIAMLSVKHDPAERQITKMQFLADLKTISKTAISRWTLALKTRKKLLDARRKQLKIHLDKNTRLRYFVINPGKVEDFNSEIVLFVSDYIEKYHFKPVHISTPILCLCSNREEIQDIQRRLFKKGIITADGYIGSQFEEAHFLREPLSSKIGGKIKWEFALRILSWDEYSEVLNKRKCDDLFIIGEPDCTSLDTEDINVEKLEGVTMKEVKYVTGVSNVYE